MVGLPLTTESIEYWVKEYRKHRHGAGEEDFNKNKAELYRDVLICVKSGAAHSRELAEAALKLEEVI